MGTDRKAGDEQARVYKPDLPRMRADVLSYHWGTTSAAQKQREVHEEVVRTHAHPGDEEVVDSDTDRDTSDESAPTTDVETDDLKEHTVEWLLPLGDKTRTHVASGSCTDDGRPLPLCQRKPFAWGCETGTGLNAALATGRQRHERCWAQAGLL